ncbi:hypothetical protein Tco_1507713 [Tanacetum coccineum]
MEGSGNDNPPPTSPPPTTPQTAPQQASHTVSTIKLLILKKGEYDIWAIKMEHYLAHTDYPIWEVIQKGNGPNHLNLPKQLLKKPQRFACEPKVWTDAPIIEEYESDSDDDCVSIPLKEIEQPSFAVDSDKHVKTSRENVKDKHTHSQYLKVNKKDLNESKRVGLGYGFTRRACFVCGSFSHLIRDCDYHEKRMAKQVELNKQKMAKGNGSGESKPKWNNVQRMNHQNQFVPTAVLTRTGRIPVNTAINASITSTNKFVIWRIKKNHSSDNEKKSLGEDASKQGRIDDADAEDTFIDETLNDARNKNNKISNSKVEDDKETALEVKKCLDTSSW